MLQHHLSHWTWQWKEHEQHICTLRCSMGGFPQLRAELKQPEATHLKDEIKEINEHVLSVSFSVDSVRFQNFTDLSVRTVQKSPRQHDSSQLSTIRLGTMGGHRNIGTSERWFWPHAARYPRKTFHNTSEVLTAIWDLLTKLCVIYPRFARDAPFCRCMSLQERIFPSQIDHLFHERQGWPRQNVIHRMVLPAISWSMSPWKTTVVITMNRS